MPTEYYFGIAIAIIVLVLLGLLLKPGHGRRRIVQHQGTASDQAAIQLSRIADSLEKLVVRLEVLQPIGKPIIQENSAGIPSVETQIIETPSMEEPIVGKPNIDVPRVEKSSAPSPSTVEASQTEEKKNDQPPERHIKLSMFGR